MVDLIREFYKPQNEKDFSGVLASADKRGMLPHLYRLLDVVPKAGVQKLVGENILCMDNGVLKSNSENFKIFGNNGRGSVVVYGGEFAKTLKQFETLYKNLKGPNCERRFENLISPVWKYNEILGLADKTEAPLSLSIAYLSDFYARMELSTYLRGALGRYEMLLEEGLGGRDAAILMAREFNPDETPDISKIMLVLENVADDNAVVTLGLANKLVGDKTYFVQPKLLDDVLKKVESVPGVMDNVEILSAPALYLVAAADGEACEKYLQKLTNSLCVPQQERLCKIATSYSDAANPNLDDIRARIREAV